MKGKKVKAFRIFLYEFGVAPSMFLPQAHWSFAIWNWWKHGFPMAAEFSINNYQHYKHFSFQKWNIFEKFHVNITVPNFYT